MIESMINPKRLEKGPIKMLFIGMLYASLSLLLVQWFFSKDVVLYQYSGIMVVFSPLHVLSYKKRGRGR